jgi:hypothetical protein
MKALQGSKRHDLVIDLFQKLPALGVKSNKDHVSMVVLVRIMLYLHRSDTDNRLLHSALAPLSRLI